MAEAARERIGKYEILEKIGAGGFGEVFKAFDPLIKRAVALKTCSSRNEDIRSRFFNEAEIAGNLHHRNITTVYDFGVHEGLPYLVQEYLSGEDLDRKIKRPADLSTDEKLAYLVQIARGLAAAHSQGVIHRDIKPANIRVLEDGTAKIMDFGIAKLAQQESGLTQTGMTLGTASYLSPEQVRGDAVDVRTDVFSFGVLAYELMTLKKPFEGKQISAVLYQVLHAEPRAVSELMPALPLELAQLIQRCLSKHPDGRFRDAGDLARALEHLQARLHKPEQPRLDNFNVTVPLRTYDTPAPTPIEGLPQRVRIDMPTVTIAPGPTAPRDQAGSAGSPPMPRGPRGLDFVELSATPSTPRAERDGVQKTMVLPSPNGGFAVAAKRRLPELPGRLLLLLALLAVAALGGWWLGQRGAGPQAQSGPSTTNAPTSTVPAPSLTPQAPGKESTPTSTLPQTTTPVETNPAKSSPPPSLPEPAAKGSVTVEKPAWTARMTVGIGRRVFTLDRDRRLELDPGTYTLSFQIEDEGYRASAARSVTIDSGAATRIDVPIAQPGLLSVRPLPRRAQGNVRINADASIATPLSRFKVAPGSLRLEIAGRDGSAATIVREVTIASGRETIVSFDLDSGDAQIVVK